jgi:hypothetical protein
MGNALRTRPGNGFDLRPAAAAIAILLAFAGIIVVNHDDTGIKVKFEVILEHGGVAVHSDIHWVLGVRASGDILTANTKAGPRAEWTLTKTAHAGEPVRLAAEVDGYTEGNRALINQHCNIYILRDGREPMPLPAYGTHIDTLCVLASIVPQ